MRTVITLKINTIFINTDKMRPTVVPQILRDSGQYTHGLFQKQPTARSSTGEP